MSYRRFKRKSGYCPLCNRTVFSAGGYCWPALLQMKPCTHCNEKASSRNRNSNCNTKAHVFKFNGQHSIIIRN